MADPASIAAISMAVASTATGVAGAAMAGDPPTGRLNLPPELEAGMLDKHNEDSYSIAKDFKQAQETYRILDEKYATLQEMYDGTLPEEEALAKLQEQTMEMAGLFADGAEEAIRKGFIDEESARLAGLIEDETSKVSDRLGDIEGTGENLALEMKAQFEDDRKRLESQLRGAGLPPEQIQRELAKFDRDGMAAIKSREEEQRNAMVGRATTGLNSMSSSYAAAGDLRLQGRNQVFEEAKYGYEAASGELERGRNSYLVSGAIAGIRAGASDSYLKYRSGLRGEGRDAYKQLGLYDFSDVTRARLRRSNKVDYEGFQSSGSEYSDRQVTYDNQGNKVEQKARNNQGDLY